MYYNEIHTYFIPDSCSMWVVSIAAAKKTNSQSPQKNTNLLKKF